MSSSGREQPSRHIRQPLPFDDATASQKGNGPKTNYRSKASSHPINATHATEPAKSLHPSSTYRAQNSAHTQSSSSQQQDIHIQRPMHSSKNDSIQYLKMDVTDILPHLRPIPSRRARDGRRTGISSVSVIPALLGSNETLQVSISLHASECILGRALILGLFRTSQNTNDKPIFVRPIRFENKLQYGYAYITNRISCKSPKSVGNFEFRVLEQLQAETPTANEPGAMEPVVSYSDAVITNSNTFRVRMGNAAFVESLTCIYDNFKQGLEKGDTKIVLHSFLTFQRLIENTENETFNPTPLFRKVLVEFLNFTRLGPEKTNATFSQTETIACPIETFHGSLRNILMLVHRNTTAKRMLSQEFLDLTHKFFNNCYCVLTGIFFADLEDKKTYWREYLHHGIIDATSPHTEDIMTSHFVQIALTGWIERQAASLIPDAQAFRATRSAIYSRIGQHIIAKLGPSARLYVFGSCANDFGMDDSDMDLGLMFTDRKRLTYAEKQEILSRVVELATKRSDLFTDIDTSRLSARIPIVMFRDASTGIQCDLCLDNMLAQRNTAFLRANAHADSRVRQLAYVLKLFVKRRRMNCASERTLSSYAYILMLIHLLQRQEPSILPVLQTLPPSWDGIRKCDCTQSKQWCRPRSPYCQLTERLPEMNLPSLCCFNADQSSTTPFETYFYDPFEIGVDSSQRLRHLHELGQSNPASLGELFMRFLLYYSVEIDASNEIVTVRMGRKLLREEKCGAENPYWYFHSRLSIEDPFETGYDVAHVLKDSRHRYIRRQFARAYAKLAEAATSSSETVDEAMEQMMSEIFEPAETLPFQVKSALDTEASHE